MLPGSATHTRGLTAGASAETTPAPGALAQHYCQPAFHSIPTPAAAAAAAAAAAKPRSQPVRIAAAHTGCKIHDRMLADTRSHVCQYNPYAPHRSWRVHCHRRLAPAHVILHARTPSHGSTFTAMAIDPHACTNTDASLSARRTHRPRARSKDSFDRGDARASWCTDSGNVVGCEGRALHLPVLLSWHPWRSIMCVCRKRRDTCAAVAALGNDSSLGRCFASPSQYHHSHCALQQYKSSVRFKAQRVVP